MWRKGTKHYGDGWHLLCVVGLAVAYVALVVWVMT